MIKELIRYMAEALVDDPQSVSVSETCGSQITVYELRVSKQDLGKIIGKQGKTADAMRTILSSVSAKQNRRAVLEILE